MIVDEIYDLSNQLDTHSIVNDSAYEDATEAGNVRSVISCELFKYKRPTPKMP
jgi:hypothetical protein